MLGNSCNILLYILLFSLVDYFAVERVRKSAIFRLVGVVCSTFQTLLPGY